MATDFAAYVAYSHAEYEVANFKVDAANPGKAGSICFLNTSDDEIEEGGADPALILGLMTGPYTSRTMYAGNKMPVICLTPGVVVALCSATTPLDAHVTRAYGLVKLASGNWALDISETVNTRVHVIRIDAAAGIFYVKFLPANLQADAILS